MKRLVLIITILLATTTAVLAVSPKDMDHARAIAAHAYLRYANDGSGYLDNVKPKSMAELEKALKPKEKENLKAFKSIAVPTNYESWDKQKLVDYWSTTAFASKSLTEKGKIGKARARKNLNAMTLSAPEKKEVKETSDAAKAQPQQQEKQAGNQNAEATPASPVPSAQTVASSSEETATIPVDSLLNAADPQLAEESEEPASREKDHTWIYVVILCVLVGVVVALVVFASNVMKRNGMQANESQVQPARDSRREAEMEKILNARMDEIERLKSENIALQGRLAMAEQAAAAAKKELAASREQLTQATASREKKNPATDVVAEAKPSRVRSIFLGRANSKGIFVRADRTLNPGLSFFRLDTSDGYAGSFRVAEDPAVWQTALANPVETLGSACSSPMLADTSGMTRIVTDSAGTAIFENGCWKVIRKAKIHYE